MGRGKKISPVRPRKRSYGKRSNGVRFSIPQEEIMSPGHVACQGCGATLAMRYALKALGRNTIVVIPACCWSVIDGPFPYSSLGVPLFHTAFETAASTASGIAAGLEMEGNKDTNVLAWAGDGGTADIGIQALSGAVERRDKIIYVCYDNEAYMNTGIQRSSSTPYGAWTTTTPVEEFKSRPKKNMVEIIAAHDIPYAASANISYPEDFVGKLKKAKGIPGAKYIQVLSPCPAGWKYSSEMTIRLGKLAFETCVYPLYEVEGGKYIVKKPARKRPVEEYLKHQGRFKHLTKTGIEQIQHDVDLAWEKLLRKESI
ncbi:MAG: 3-methyl-2-oxobutanoate dehydrogenase subunit beta [Candidatus Omnitrophica bacterium]|nr:3-methyl-2-oxobutanoate dehydrogenase subunit beta [Candidatus Omnitrophota bacterium]